MIALDARGGERDVDVEWLPAEARPPRKVARKEAFTADELHPPPTVATNSGGITSVQTFIGGDAHAESIRRGAARGGEKLFYCEHRLGEDRRRRAA